MIEHQLLTLWQRAAGMNRYILYNMRTRFAATTLQ